MPRPLGDRLAVKFPDGLYASWWWPFGGMRLFAAVEKGRVKRWLTIERGGKAGCVDLEGRSQRFYANGMVEDFGFQDDSLPYRADADFKTWVRRQIEEVVGLARVDSPPKPPPIILPIPALTTVLAELEAWSGSLAFSNELYFHLKSRQKLSEEDAALVTECLVAAFSGQQFLWEAFWEGPFGCRKRLWSEFALCQEAASLRPSARIRMNLSGCSRSNVPEGCCRILAPLPEAVGCRLRSLQVLCELVLRQEACRSELLTEGFFPRASLAGACLLAPELDAPLDFEDDLLPWTDHPADQARAELASLRDHMCAGETLGSWASNQPVLARGLAPFFIERAHVIGELFHQITTGFFRFPVFHGLEPWPTSSRPLSRDAWRDLAEKAMRFLPDGFPRLDPVNRSRMQNRLAALGQHFAGEAENPELTGYLERHRKLEDVVRAGLEALHGTPGLGPQLIDRANAVLFVLEGFHPQSRQDGSIVRAAGEMSRLLGSRLIR